VGQREGEMLDRIKINRWTIRAMTLLTFVAVTGAGKKYR
jgi:hypothetical protein